MFLFVSKAFEGCLANCTPRETWAWYLWRRGGCWACHPSPRLRGCPQRVDTIATILPHGKMLKGNTRIADEFPGPGLVVSPLNRSGSEGEGGGGSTWISQDSYSVVISPPRESESVTCAWGRMSVTTIGQVTVSAAVAVSGTGLHCWSRLWLSLAPGCTAGRGCGCGCRWHRVAQAMYISRIFAKAPPQKK